MDELRLIDALYGLLVLTLGGLFTQMREQMKDHQRAHEDLNSKVDARDEALNKSIADLRNTVSRDYIPRAEVGALFSRIEGSLIRIEQKLDGKQDK